MASNGNSNHYLGVLPPSQTSGEQRASLEYRCQRLQGLTGLYYRAMQWTVHRASGWQLGENAYQFILDQKELWLLGIETIADLAKTGWDDQIASRIAVREKQSPHGNGTIRLSDIKRDHNGKIAKMLARSSFQVLDKNDVPKFSGGDLMASVQFGRAPNAKEATTAGSLSGLYQLRMDLNCLPWTRIAMSLNQAYVNAERHLRDEGICWNSPPLFRQCATGRELLKFIDAKKLEYKEVLADLDERQRTLFEQVETVMRVDIQQKRKESAEAASRDRERVGPKLLSGHSELIANLKAAVEEAGDLKQDTVEERMFATIAKGDETVIDWPATRWASEINCSESAVKRKGNRAWTAIKAMRAERRQQQKTAVTIE